MRFVPFFQLTQCGFMAEKLDFRIRRPWQTKSSNAKSLSALGGRFRVA